MDELMEQDREDAERAAEEWTIQTYEPIIRQRLLDAGWRPPENSIESDARKLSRFAGPIPF